MTVTNKSGAVVLVLGTNANLARAMVKCPAVRRPAVIGYAHRIARTGYTGARADFTGDAEEWRAHCADVFSKAEADGESKAWEWFGSVCDRIDAGAPFVVVQSADWSEHDPKNEVYAAMTGRAAWAMIADLASETITV